MLHSVHIDARTGVTQLDESTHVALILIILADFVYFVFSFSVVIPYRARQELGCQSALTIFSFFCFCFNYISSIN
eukprot:SAG31_NODE_150_length_22290_cov_5.975801_25_plen_75_part_00